MGSEMCIRDRLSAVPEEAVSTPLPEATSFDHGVGLLSHAGEDVLLSLLANQRGLYKQTNAPAGARTW